MNDLIDFLSEVDTVGSDIYHHIRREVQGRKKDAESEMEEEFLDFLEEVAWEYYDERENESLSEELINELREMDEMTSVEDLKVSEIALDFSIISSESR